jgi:RNA polymerase sigma-70 factor (ECF subfamily)
MELHSHNRQEFELLYNKYAPGLIFYGRKFVDYQTAEDVVHDVFLKIWCSDTVMFDNENISVYLFNAVRNMCFDLLKHQVVHDDYVSNTVMAMKLEELALDENIIDKMIEQERIDTVYKAIDRLPEKCREVFVQAYMEEKKNLEIAEQLHISVRTVEAHIFKALKLLRNVLTSIIF